MKSEQITRSVWTPVKHFITYATVIWRMHWLSKDLSKLIYILEEFCVFEIISFLRVLTFFVPPEIKCFALSGGGENPYVFSLRQGECTPNIFFFF